MKSFKKYFLNESLDSKQKATVDNWDQHDMKFSDHIFGGPKETHHTIFVPLSHSDFKAQAPEDLKDHLKQNGYNLHDYHGGYAKDKYGRNVSIGKILEKTDATGQFKKKFMSDPDRYATQNIHNMHVVITRHPHHVAAQSTGQGWTSCTDMENEENSYRIKADIAHGTHVAYLTKTDDHQLKYPTARIALKPFTSNNKTILVPEPTTYGTSNPIFEKTVNDWASKHTPTEPNELYTKPEHVYSDNGNSLHYDKSLESIKNIYEKYGKHQSLAKEFIPNVDLDTQKRIYSDHKGSSDIVSKLSTFSGMQHHILDDVGKEGTPPNSRQKLALNSIAFSYSKAPGVMDRISKMSLAHDDDVLHRDVANNLTHSDQVEHFINHHDDKVRDKLPRIANKDQLKRLSSDRSDRVRASVAYHGDHDIREILKNDPSHKVRESVLAKGTIEQKKHVIDNIPDYDTLKAHYSAAHSGNTFDMLHDKAQKLLAKEGNGTS